MQIWVDADACPKEIKELLFRAASRRNVKVTLVANQLPQQVTGFFLASRTQEFTANPGGSHGDLCVGGEIGRFVGPGQIQNSGSSGTFQLALDLTRTPQPTGFVSVTPSETWNFQAWHRDSSVGIPLSNFTDAVSVTFQ